VNEPGHRQSDDHSKSVHGSGSITEVKLIGFDNRFFSAVALAISLLCFLYAFKVDREQAQEAYWRQRAESFLETLATQGYKVPADLLPSKGAKP
jgi:hypothetical protein